MNTRLTVLSLGLVLALTPLVRPNRADAQRGAAGKKPAPVIVKAQAHAMHFNDFQVRRSRDRALEAEISKKGLDVAFTEWMMRDHPYIFAEVCSKEVGKMATEFKSTPHMADFDGLLGKRSDLRLKADKYGHDVAFAEWLRTEKPDTYRRHFGLGPDNRPLKKGDAPKDGGKK